MVSTQPPSGFRDFIQADARLRANLIQKISNVYQSFGFSPIETPALENLDVLLGSGGGVENEKLIFKIMKRGDKLKDALPKGEDAIADFGLRFDLTVPLSRVVASSRGQIQFPFKVFHIGPVWRAERAQKGRFREFIQCDVDIVGAKSNAAELEVIQAVVAAISAVGADGFELRLNDRRLLQSLGKSLGLSDEEFSNFAILLDKKDKLEPVDLISEMKTLLGPKMSNLVEKVINEEVPLIEFAAMDKTATEELTTLIDQLEKLNLPLTQIIFDPSLMRGIGYYTGTVFELRHSSAGYSFGGGGRYDQLISRFSKESIPACGFSIGFERLFLLLKEKVQESGVSRAHSIFVPVFEERFRSEVLKVASKIRASGIEVDVYPDTSKLKAQFKYASDRSFQWVLIIGEEELESRTFKLKNFETEQESSIAEVDLISFLRKAFSALPDKSRAD